MTKDVLRFDPDPKVLLALTHTPLKPLDALCELIDNGLDSFRVASVQGNPVKHPLLDIAVPGGAEVRRGEGLIRVIDNGAGLTRRGLSNALRAGYSEKNRYDTLGLFGLGFNIATGKLGMRTVVTTARNGDPTALRVVIDLPEVVRSGKFEAPVEAVAKPVNFDHGTIVEVSGWWPPGNPNAGFAADLAGIPKANLRTQLGRRYAIALRRDVDSRARILLNDEPVEAFEHCTWSSSRFVERHGWGVIPARSEFDQVIYSQRRCLHDGALVDEHGQTCPECGRSDFRTLDERIRGWVGIQRFDDNDRFGIDLFRNGRAIRVGEKDAFFNSSDGVESVKEYPTDQQTGRIVGEVQLDHVPVDFQKQDFQRSSAEWQRAMQFLRGTSLLPSKWTGDSRNESPVSRLFQGFRKVRNIGLADMYMGTYDSTARKAVRIGREVERDYYERFLAREPGYYDDSKWWELVESANVPPIVALQDCPSCGYQNLPDDDTCAECGHILKSKECANCHEVIGQNATICPVCGESQIPEVQEPWRCNVCGAVNGIDDEKCAQCDALRGAENPISVEVLRRGEAWDELSFDGRTFALADGGRSEPLAVKVRRAGSLRPSRGGPPVPSIAAKSAGLVEVFIDPAHFIFTQLGVHPHEAVAVEAAQYLYSVRADLAGRPTHSVQTLASQVLMEVWGEELAQGPARLRDEIAALFGRLASALESNPDSADFYDELDAFELRELTDRLIAEGALDKLPELRKSGAYLRVAPPGVVARFFVRKPDGWFGRVWRDRLPDPNEVGEDVASNGRAQMIGVFARCLDDCAAFIRYSSDDPLVLTRTRVAREYLEDHLA